MSRHVFVLMLFLSLSGFNHCQNTLYIKNVTLTPQNAILNGATMNILSQSEVTSSTDFWNIDVNVQDTWHLMIDLDNSW